MRREFMWSKINYMCCLFSHSYRGLLLFLSSQLCHCFAIKKMDQFDLNQTMSKVSFSGEVKFCLESYKVPYMKMAQSIALKFYRHSACRPCNWQESHFLLFVKRAWHRSMWCCARFLLILGYVKRTQRTNGNAFYSYILAFWPLACCPWHEYFYFQKDDMSGPKFRNRKYLKFVKIVIQLTW